MNGDRWYWTNVVMWCHLFVGKDTKLNMSTAHSGEASEGLLRAYDVTIHHQLMLE